MVLAPIGLIPEKVADLAIFTASPGAEKLQRMDSGAGKGARGTTPLLTVGTRKRWPTPRFV